MLECSIASDEALFYWEPEEAFHRIREAGFTCVDFGLFAEAGSAFWDGEWETHALRARRAADAAGVRIGQIHSPFPTWGADSGHSEAIFQAVTNSLRAAALLGSPYAVVHALVPENISYAADREEIWEQNLRFYRRIAPVARECGVTIAIENLFDYDREHDSFRPMICNSPDALVRLIDTLGDGFAACLDTGHALLNGYEPATFARALGGRLAALHVHDNDGLSDQHTAPYLGKIQWGPFCDALREIGYSGSFSFETFAFTKRYLAEALVGALGFLGKLGRVMADMCV